MQRVCSLGTVRPFIPMKDLVELISYLAKLSSEVFLPVVQSTSLSRSSRISVSGQAAAFSGGLQGSAYLEWLGCTFTEAI